jgi:hypothetical protein
MQAGRSSGAAVSSAPRLAVLVASWSDRPRVARRSAVSMSAAISGSRTFRQSCTCARRCRRVAKELPLIATSLEADLVVTGCYDPSRTREHIFGGASRDFSIFGVAPGYGPSKRSVEKHVASGSRGIIGFPSTPPTTSMGCSRNAATHFALSPIVPSLRPQNSA